MTDSWFQDEFNTIRKELVEAEDELVPILETDFIDDECTCIVDPSMCEIHNPQEDENR